MTTPAAAKGPRLESPGGRYADGAFAALEGERLWPRSWLVVGREDQLPEPGHYFTWEHTGVPLLVLRSADGEVRAFYNSCRHRGAPVVREARGRNRALRCQYHSWTYDTFGRLVSVPDERDFVDLRLEERALVPVQAATRGGWVFVNQWVGPPSLEDELGELAGSLAGSPGAAHRVLMTRTWTAVCNWKLLAAQVRSGHSDYPTRVPLFPCGQVEADGESSLGLFAWPLDERTSLLEAILCAPDWGEEESPEASPEWRRRIHNLEAEAQGYVADAEAAHRDLRAGKPPGRVDAALEAAVDAAIGPDRIPVALRAPA